MMINHLVIAPVLLPLLMAVLLLLLRQQRLFLQRILSIISVIGQIVLAIGLLVAVGSGEILVYAVGNWSAPFGIVLVADRLAAWMLMITALLSLCALIYAVRGADRAGQHFHVLFQLQLLGLNGAFLTGDLFNLFVFFEVLLLASYSLLLHGGGRLRTKAGLHFVVINLVGSTLFLFAVGTLYGTLGTLNMADLAVKVAETAPENIFLVRTAGLLLFAVFALKAALLPLYAWLPAAYAHTSASVAALFAIMTKVGAYSILRVYTLIFGQQAGPAANLIEGWLLPLALATLIVGMFGVLASTHLRQQVAYLVVVSIGSLFIAFGLNTSAGIAAGIYYLPHSTFAAAAFFLLTDAIANRRGEASDKFEVGMAITHQRLFGVLFFTAAVLIIGLPPLSGFVGKFLILRAAIGHPGLLWIMSIVLVTSLLGLIALARSGSLLFYRTHAAEATIASATSAETGIMPVTRELIPIISLLALCLILVIQAGPVMDFALATADQLLKPSAYIDAVLSNGGIR
ncbi:MAG: monovalent cation/H+ antiporter subunit D [Nitrosomonas sp.]|nr:monovalent cation/H+ antiporter subunit D [Nitrosomonas sp.]MDP1951516.1 monovalent cation/H+ antiporter subunit D [Nitrosomonas sp.]